MTILTHRDLSTICGGVDRPPHGTARHVLDCTLTLTAGGAAGVAADQGMKYKGVLDRAPGIRSLLAVGTTAAVSFANNYIYKDCW
jgi:hypothetical protein